MPTVQELEAQYHPLIQQAAKEVQDYSNRLAELEEKKRTGTLSNVEMGELAEVSRQIGHKQRVLANYERRFGQKVTLEETRGRGEIKEEAMAEFEKPKPEMIKVDPDKSRLISEGEKAWQRQRLQEQQEQEQIKFYQSPKGFLTYRVGDVKPPIGYEEITKESYLTGRGMIIIKKSGDVEIITKKPVVAFSEKAGELYEKRYKEDIRPTQLREITKDQIIQPTDVSNKPFGAATRSDYQGFISQTKVSEYKPDETGFKGFIVSKKEPWIKYNKEFAEIETTKQVKDFITTFETRRKYAPTIEFESIIDTAKAERRKRTEPWIVVPDVEKRRAERSLSDIFSLVGTGTFPKTSVRKAPVPEPFLPFEQRRRTAERAMEDTTFRTEFKGYIKPGKKVYQEPFKDYGVAKQRVEKSGIMFGKGIQSTMIKEFSDTEGLFKKAGAAALIGGGIVAIGATGGLATPLVAAATPFVVGGLTGAWLGEKEWRLFEAKQKKELTPKKAGEIIGEIPAETIIYGAGGFAGSKLASSFIPRRTVLSIKTYFSNELRKAATKTPTGSKETRRIAKGIENLFPRFMTEKGSLGKQGKTVTIITGGSQYGKDLGKVFGVQIGKKTRLKVTKPKYDTYIEMYKDTITIKDITKAGKVIGLKQVPKKQSLFMDKDIKNIFQLRKLSKVKDEALEVKVGGGTTVKPFRDVIFQFGVKYSAELRKIFGLGKEGIGLKGFQVGTTKQKVKTKPMLDIVKIGSEKAKVKKVLADIKFVLYQPEYPKSKVQYLTENIFVDKQWVKRPVKKAKIQPEIIQEAEITATFGGRYFYRKEPVKFKDMVEVISGWIKKVKPKPKKKEVEWDNIFNFDKLPKDESVSLWLAKKPKTYDRKASTIKTKNRIEQKEYDKMMESSFLSEEAIQTPVQIKGIQSVKGLPKQIFDIRPITYRGTNIFSPTSQRRIIKEQPTKQIFDINLKRFIDVRPETRTITDIKVLTRTKSKIDTKTDTKIKLATDVFTVTKTRTLLDTFTQTRAKTKTDTRTRTQTKSRTLLQTQTQVPALTTLQRTIIKQQTLTTPPPPFVPFDFSKFKFKTPGFLPRKPFGDIETTYTPTLIGIEFLKPIKYSPRLSKIRFTGLSIRPPVIINTFKPKKRRKKKR